MTMTRRSLLGAMARLGGAGAVYETLAVWDFLKPPPALAAGLELPKDSGAGKPSRSSGAGVAGLCAAYELDRAGYDCVDAGSLAPHRRAQSHAAPRRRVQGDAHGRCRSAGSTRGCGSTPARAASRTTTCTSSTIAASSA